MSNLQSKTVRELRQIAADLRIVGRSKLTTKAQLVAAIERAQARPIAIKGPTVESLRQICRDRKLTGWSRYTKTQLLSLVESTANLAAKPANDDDVILHAMNDLPVHPADSITMARILTGRANQNDKRHWDMKRLTAIATLRDSAPCDRQRNKWANKYVSVSAGVY